jgi:hypothetical protein
MAVQYSWTALRPLLAPLLATLGALGVLAILVYWIRSWWRDNDGLAASGHELLFEYREMHRQGELTDEEYRIIKSRIASGLSPRPAPQTMLPGSMQESVSEMPQESNLTLRDATNPPPTTSETAS